MWIFDEIDHHLVFVYLYTHPCCSTNIFKPKDRMQVSIEHLCWQNTQIDHESNWLVTSEKPINKQIRGKPVRFGENVRWFHDFRAIFSVKCNRCREERLLCQHAARFTQHHSLSRLQWANVSFLSEPFLMWCLMSERDVRWPLSNIYHMANEFVFVSNRSHRIHCK